MYDSIRGKLNLNTGDVAIDCSVNGCSNVIVFTKRDQEFFAKKEWPKPRRCSVHRQKQI